MMEVIIHWTSVPGDGVQRYLVDVPSVGGGSRPNPFDHIQADIAIDAALKQFRSLPQVKDPAMGVPSDRWSAYGRTIRKIELHQTEDEVIPGVGR